MKTSDLVQEAIEACKWYYERGVIFCPGCSKSHCPNCHFRRSANKLQAALPRIKAEEAVVEAVAELREHWYAGFQRMNKAGNKYAWMDYLYYSGASEKELAIIERIEALQSLEVE